ncbi:MULTISPECIES: MocR-like pyridoxine biosynthesis transcription factor PdxR [unclassified Bacillus (in: firmicutes)]|uniref:MocR-like pyridoxine biosynthesis transcription factor PdxR n=1 Tax=unclassified Bacillus (in: firmicutes) TaxID=185979 RepID=UPI000C7938B9|nr:MULTISPECIES: PLP-dependent aminotransferase family protein [unclassified Bacillus (in: firmicutes)]MDT0159053.1 PLP-dependent aminotransferase family protein [Bacillus sp. AG4(2022)]PLR74406.1 PLP-dependent aminotransferase family protein [Bacillus sp. UMB0728]
MTPFLDRESQLPLYVQLYQYIKSEIESGKMKPGEKLPSIRKFSRFLDVSKNTVEEAYHQLIAEGYAESRPKSGIVVNKIDEFPLKQVKEQLPVILKKEQAKPKIDFQYGHIDAIAFPARRWKNALSEAAFDLSFLQYGDKQGQLSLRTELTGYLYRSRGIECTPEQIIITSGTQNSISVIMSILELRGEVIAMENPGYDGVRKVLMHQGGKVEPVSVEEDGISVEELAEKRAKAVYVTPSHQFPLGMVLSINKRLKLLKWAAETGGYIVEDDYDSEFRYQGQPIPPLKSLDQNDRVIYLGTFSKSFLPAARLSFIVLPPALIAGYKRDFSLYSQPVSPIMQEAAARFLKEGDFDQHIRKMRVLYQAKHKVLLESVSSMMGNKAAVIGQKAGLHILIKLEGRKSEELAAKAAKNGVKVYSANQYWANGDGDDSIMLGFGGLSAEEIAEGIKILTEAWFE